MLADPAAAVMVIHHPVADLRERFRHTFNAAMTPQGSCPATRGDPSPTRPSAAAPPLARYIFRSLPHIPDALISITARQDPASGRETP